ncbi:phage integrase N-terminal domain-containing protein [Paraburkholderia sp. GAS32]|uniref:phage integrase N-terminal domain-containing protein n=1 Tax=Paraburkholderia sp. GAS32 TaxID=3035129 RepID=UPI003D1E7378
MGADADGWFSRVDAILKANLHRRVNGRVAANRTMQHNRTVIEHAFDTWHNKLNHKIKVPQNLTDRHVQVLVRYWYEEGKAASTMRGDLSVIRKFFGWMGKKGVVRSLDEYLPDAPPERIKVRGMGATGNKSKSWSEAGIDVEQKLQEAFALDERFGIIVAMQLAFGYRRKETIRIRPWLNDLRPLGQYAFMMYERDGTKGGRQRLIRIEFPFQVWVLDYAKSRISKRSNLGWPKTRRGDNATLKQNIERYKYYMKKLGIGRSDVSVTGHGLRAEYAENCGLLRGFVPASLGGKANQMSRDDLRILQRQVSENLGHSRERVTQQSYYGTFGKIDPKDATAEQPQSGQPENVDPAVASNTLMADASLQQPAGTLATASQLDRALAEAGEPPRGYLGIVGSYYISMPQRRERPDGSKPPVPGVGRLAAANANSATAKPKVAEGRRKGAMKVRPYDERQLRLPLKDWLPTITRVTKGKAGTKE